MKRAEQLRKTREAKRLRRQARYKKFHAWKLSREEDRRKAMKKAKSRQKRTESMQKQVKLSWWKKLLNFILGRR